jgi:glutathione S-transferase
MAYKISYFTFKGLGEPVRYLLAYGNVDFIDERIAWEDWKKLKPSKILLL